MEIHASRGPLGVKGDAASALNQGCCLGTLLAFYSMSIWCAGQQQQYTLWYFTVTLDPYIFWVYWVSY